MQTSVPPITSAQQCRMAVAAVCIHLSIGSIYAYSVWKLPLSEATGWSGGLIASGFSLAILVLGVSAAFLGPWIDQQGPRKTCLLAGCCYGAGLVAAGASVHVGFPPGYPLSYGVLCGVGLGMGYVAPVATLVRWFPKRRGFATGLATMGFGFGALLAGPLIATLTSRLDVPRAFLILGFFYAAVICLSALVLKNPPGYTPVSHTDLAPANRAGAAMRSPRFLILWLLFFINIACGIALIAIAAPMAMELAAMSRTRAAAMVGLMGLFNGLGRIGWSAASDFLGRPLTWLLFFLIQIAAFLLLPHLTQPLGFQLAIFAILTCYGGGFATAPAYLGDLFGTRHLATLYGTLLTAWALAGLTSPLFAGWLRETRGHYRTLPLLFAATLAAGLLLHIVLFWLTTPKKGREILEQHTESL